MSKEIIEQLLSPFGLFVLFIIFLLSLPLLKLAAWKLFSFDSKVQEILFQKKSSEVRTGKVAEVMAPLLDNFPVDVTKEGTSTVFIGQPIDYIHFDPEEGVTFIEVKSAGARLSQTQKKILDHVENGNVFWAEVKISGDKS